MVHQHVERLRKLLRQSESKCADGEAKLADSEAKRADAEAKLAEREAKLAEREAKFLEGERVIAGLQDNKVSLQETLKQSMLETNMGKLARQACEEEINLLRKRSGVILESLDSLEEEKLARKQHHYKAKNSVLRSFQWKEKDTKILFSPGHVVSGTDANIAQVPGMIFKCGHTKIVEACLHCQCCAHALGRPFGFRPSV
jgi:hypothetical protein